MPRGIKMPLQALWVGKEGKREKRIKKARTSLAKRKTHKEIQESKERTRTGSEWIRVSFPALNRALSLLFFVSQEACRSTKRDSERARIDMFISGTQSTENSLV